MVARNHRSPGALFLRECRLAFAAVAFFSLLVGLLTLSVPLYSLQVFDRVLGSRSAETLLVLTLGIAFVLVLIAALEIVRSQLMIRIGARIDRGLSRHIMRLRLRDAAKSGMAGGAERPLTDANQVRAFLTGTGLFALLDAPWAPLFLALVFLFNQTIGLIALAGAGLSLAIAALAGALTRGPLVWAEELNRDGARREEFLQRNAETLEAMGMTDRILDRWQADRNLALAWEATASGRVATLSIISRYLRLGIQTALTGTGAYLVITDQITIGVMVACTILGARGIAPFDSAIQTWRGMGAALAAYRRIGTFLARTAATDAAPDSGHGDGSLVVERLIYAPPGSPAPLLKGFSFALRPGEILGVTGPVGAGKSTLAKALLGLRRPVSGSVRLGGIEAFNLDPSIRSAWIGYLPQNPELLPGTIAENIARYGERDMEAVQEAGMLAGIHEVILSLPLGYDTTVNADSPFLSGGQRQLVGLARAIYGKPHYIVLDEPSSMIDRTASDRIGQILGQLKARGAIVVLISHRRSLLLRSDAVMLMEAGRIVDMKRPNPQKRLDPARPPALTSDSS